MTADRRRPTRAGFGPTLPELLHDRLGVAPRTATIACIAVAVLALAAVGAAAWPGDGRALLVHRGPDFRLLYSPEVLRPVAPREGEHERLEGRHGPLSLVVTVRPFGAASLPGLGPVAALPIHADAHIAALARRLTGFRLREQRHLRVNWAPGYDIRFGAGPPGAREYGRDLIVFPDEVSTTGAMLLSLRVRRARRVVDRPTEDRIAAAHRVLRSFSFGIEPG